MLYKIKSGENVIGTTEKLTHCRKLPNGTVSIDETGDGIVFQNTIFNIEGYDTVTIEEISTEIQIQDIQDSLLDVMHGITDLYEGGTN